MKEQEIIWKQVLGYDYYEISNTGLIRSKDRIVTDKNGKFLRLNKSKLLRPRIGVYLMIGLNKEGVQKQFLIHRLVAEHFINRKGNKNQVNHKNGDKHDNRLENLEWVTPSENQRHAFKNGLKTPTWLGKKLSNETRHKMSASKMGKPAHNKGKSKGVVHGTISGYIRYKCRCTMCKKANTDYCRIKRSHKQLKK